MAIYAVRNKASGDIRMVAAPTNAAALRHVAGDELAVTIPKPREIAELAGRGVTVEDYGEEPEAEAVAQEGGPDHVHP